METVSLGMEMVSLVKETVSLVMENLFRVMEMVSLVMEMAPTPIQSPLRFNPPFQPKTSASKTAGELLNL
jgi:hypothetical protein